MKRVFPFLLFVLFLVVIVSAQNNECATDYFHHQMMQEDTVYRNQILLVESQIASAIQNNTKNKSQLAVYTIPVVVHVIHKGEAVGSGTNISDAQIQGAITGLNNRWRNIIGSGVDMEIEFCLAIRDPNGNATNGINRVDGSAIANYSAQGISLSGCSTGAAENSVKVLSRWPVSSYYNIWVVNKICNGQWGGWTYFPYGGVNDGATIISSSFTSSSTLPTHEVGHGFFGYHTFEGDGGNVSCPVDNNCTTNGDRVCDTPPHKQGDCSTTNPCTATGTWFNSRYNYMSYCSGLNRFTQGQKDRLRAAAETNPRLSLLTSPACTPATGIDKNTAADDFTIAPNPVRDLFTIQNSTFSIEEIEIYNVLGERVYQSINPNQQTVLDVSNYENGIYFVRIKSANKSLTKPIVVL